MKIGRLRFVLIVTSLIVLISDAAAQCVMCRSAIEGDKDVAEGFNNGILYLMVIPYIFLAGTLYYAIKQRKRRKAEGNE